MYFSLTHKKTHLVELHELLKIIYIFVEEKIVLAFFTKQDLWHIYVMFFCHQKLFIWIKLFLFYLLW